MATATPVLRLVGSDGTVIDLLDQFQLCEPYWNPGISKFKQGGTFADSLLANGRVLNNRVYSNVIETIPLTIKAIDQELAIEAINTLLEITRRIGDYWTQQYEYEYFWLEVKVGCNDCFTGYTRIYKADIINLNNPFGQPFFSPYGYSAMENLSLVIEREPFWRMVPPGQVIGPLYNLIKNPDFELWNFGTINSQPDNWDDLETLWIVGTNNQETSLHKFGQSCLKVHVSNSTATGAAKGVTQAISENVKDETEYTVIVWVKSEGITNGVGRVLITYADQLELYRDSDAHDWVKYTGKITTGVSDTIGISCEILSTANATSGTIYFEGLMLIEGDYTSEEYQAVLPQMSSSFIVNRNDTPEGTITAGNINYVDVWNIPGDMDALIKLDFQNNTDPADSTNVVEKFEVVRMGMRRSRDITKFDNFYDPGGAAETDGSGDTKITLSTTSTSWKTLYTKELKDVEIIKHNLGRLRCLVRVKDKKTTGSPNLLVRLSYSIGVANLNQKILNPVTVPVQNQWTVVDLTPNAAIVRDRKYDINPPSQLGITIDVSRDSGTDAVELDYVMLMPTDGGYIEATLDPPLAKNKGLTIDSTGSQQNPSATFFQTSWREEADLDTGAATTNFRDWGDFKGNLYAGLETVNTTGAWIYRRSPTGDWAGVYFASALGDGVTGIRSFQQYNGNFYAGLETAASWKIAVSSDGITFSITHTTAESVQDVRSMAIYDGKLWIGSGIDTTMGAPRDAYISSYDGSSWVDKVFTVTSAINDCTIDGMIVFKNKLWVVGEVDAIYAYSPSTGWVEKGGTPGGAGDSGGLNKFAILNDVLFMTGAQDTIFRYIESSDTWVEITVDLGNQYATDIVTYNNKLWLVTRDNNVFVSDDGSTWVKAFASPPTAPATYIDASLHVFDNELYFGNTSNSQTWAGVETEGSYTPSDIKGISFLAPAKQPLDEKRHRYFFSFTRVNDINSADDKAFIGIGFVPLYFALRERD